MKAADSAACSRAGKTSSFKPANWAFKSMNGTAGRATDVPVSRGFSASFSIAVLEFRPGPQKAGRAPGHHRSRGHVLRHDRPGPDQGPFADRYPTQNHRPGPDRGPLTHACRDYFPVGLGLRLSGGRGSRVGVVDEHDPMADEHLVLDCHPLADKGVARDLAPGSD